MFLDSISATTFSGSGRAAFSLIGRTPSVLQPERTMAAESAAEARSVRTSGLRIKRKLPQAAADSGSPRITCKIVNPRRVTSQVFSQKPKRIQAPIEHG